MGVPARTSARHRPTITLRTRRGIPRISGSVATTARIRRSLSGTKGAPHHWTDHNIAVHTFTCVLALQLAHLLRLKARRAGHDLSVKALLDTLSGIQETLLIYPSTGGRPKARRITTDTTTDQQALFDLYNLQRWWTDIGFVDTV